MIKKIIDIIASIKKVPIREDTRLFDEGVMDSFSVFNDLIPAIEQEYGIKFQAIDILPENFETPEKIADFVMRAKKR